MKYPELNEYEEIEYLEAEAEFLNKRITDKKEALKGFTREEYEQALIRYHHPRHAEAMAIRANRIIPSFDKPMSFQEEKALERHYEPRHLGY